MNYVLAKSNIFCRKSYECVFKKALYTLIGEIFALVYVKLPKVIPTSVKQKIVTKAVHYYTKGMNLVFPDGWSDKGLTSYVLLARLHYNARDWGQLKDVMAKLGPLLKEAEGSPAIMESLAYINALVESDININNHYEDILVPTWDSSVRLNHPVDVGNYLLQQMEMKAREIDGIELD